MKWFNLKFHTNKIKKKIYNNPYFQYEFLQKVKRKLEVGEVISGFTLDSTGNSMWVAFGDNGKKVNCVRINTLPRVEEREECGFLYITCELGPNVDNPNMTVDELEESMANYCLFLRYAYNKEDHFGRGLYSSMIIGSCAMG